jgi:hypothetical protein
MPGLGPRPSEPSAGRKSLSLCTRAVGKCKSLIIRAKALLAKSISGFAAKGYI